MASSVRNIVVTTSPGIERMLADEIKGLCVGSSVHILPGKGVVCSTAAEIKGDVAGASLPMWKTCLLSRLAETVKVRLVEPTFCQWEKHLTEVANNAPWRNFIPLHAPIPEFKVKTNKSRLFHPLHVAKVVEEVLTHKRSNARHSQLNSDTLDTVDGVSSPSVSVSIDEDELEMLVDAEGGLNDRCRQGKLSHAALAAVIIKTGCLNSGLVWDPFCNDGSFMVEAAAMSSGLPVGSPTLPYPFTMYPTHAPESFRELIEQLHLRPHAQPPTLIGSDFDVSVANEALSRMISTAPRPVTSSKVLASKVEFTNEPMVQVARRVSGGTIVTVLPDNLTRQAMLEFVDVIKLKWKGVYVMVPRTSKFRASSGLDWRPELRVTCQLGRLYELLRLC